MPQMEFVRKHEHTISNYQVGATTALRVKKYQAVPIELLHERRFVVQPVEMHPVQIEHDVAVQIPLRRKIDVAWMAGDLFGGPCSG